MAACQLVNDFGFDQRRVHIETYQAGLNLIAQIFLNDDIDIQRFTEQQRGMANSVNIDMITRQSLFDALNAIGARRAPRQVLYTLFL